VLPGLSPALQVTLKDGRNAFLWSDTLLKNGFSITAAPAKSVTLVVLMMRILHHKVKEVRMQRDGQRVILRQSVQGSVRAVSAVRNTRVFQTEITVVADDTMSPF